MNKLEKKQAVLDKYFPNMGFMECSFSPVDGKCTKCGIFFADSKMRLCSVIGIEEVANFKGLHD